ncbi:MAG TPA: hypothetical protein VH593_16085, partial [Ktedonobacteraceae bacterium]
RMAVVIHYTQPSEGSTTVCTDELRPVIPHAFPPAPGWSPDGHRIKAPLEYSRGHDKVWIDASAADTRWEGDHALCGLAQLQKLHRVAQRD